jgi:DNA-binding MarR family transcriptional regulator
MAKKALKKVAKKRPSAKTDSKRSLQQMSLAVTVGKTEPVRYEDVTKVHPALQTFFCYCLQKVALRHKDQVERDLNQLNLNLFTPQLGVLYVIEHGESVSQNDVGEKLGIDKASMVKIIDRLEDAKVIERKQSLKDRRVNFLNITPKGEKIIKQAKEILEIQEGKFLSPLSESEVKVFKDLLYRLLAHSK